MRISQQLGPSRQACWNNTQKTNRPSSYLHFQRTQRQRHRHTITLLTSFLIISLQERKSSRAPEGECTHVDVMIIDNAPQRFFHKQSASCFTISPRERQKVHMFVKNHPRCCFISFCVVIFLQHFIAITAPAFISVIHAQVSCSPMDSTQHAS